MYDTIIIGCGPSGMTAAVYLLRYNKKVLILEKESIGGAITSSPLVENYPGYKSISGTELMNNLYEQVIDLGGNIELEEVLKVEKKKDIYKVTTDSNKYETKTVIVATGTKHRLLGLPKEEEFIGNGVSFCVACDGAFYKDKKVAVIGGGNSAIISALTLSDICSEVIVIQKLGELTAEKNLIDKLSEKTNVSYYFNSEVVELLGTDELTGIVVNNNGINEEVSLDGMFICIGQVSQNDIIKDLVTLNDYGYAESDESCVTKEPGIFVAGDARSKNIRQLTTAVGDGTIAALNAISYMDK